jgi:S1-C subfamily serine protease
MLGPEQMRQLLEGMASAERGQLDLADLKARFQNAVVKIEYTAVENVVETKFNPTKSESYYAGQEPPHGSGFFIDQRDILTNAHVVEEARRGSIRIKSPATGNVEFKVDIVGIAWSESIDLAVLRLPEDEAARFMKRAALEKIPALALGNSDSVRQADALAVFGYPQSSDELKIIQCKVTGRQYLKLEFDEFVCGHQFIEVGPAGVVQPGNSGGPALNAAGEVVGIPSRGSGWAFEQGWLIPSRVVRHFLEQVYDSEEGRQEVTIPQLGISLTENFPGTAVWSGVPEEMIIFEVGVVVRHVIPNSLAADWGLKANDIMLGFANRQKGFSCALDFKGYRITTGKMAHWPPREDTPTTMPAEEPAKLHLNELVMMSEADDEVTVWYVRPGVAGIQRVEKKMTVKPPVRLPHLGVFEKPAFELWGDFVAQDFNDFNVRLYQVPAQEILKGGVLVTFTEPNSLASRRGMELAWRQPFGFSISTRRGYATRWVIIDSLNGEAVKTLAEFRAALRKAENVFEEKKKVPDYDPKRKSLMRERYVQIGFRTNRTDGTVLHLQPAFPIDEALETRPESLPTSGR